MKFKTIEDNIIQWGIDRNLYEKSDIAHQFSKLQEEVIELKEALSPTNQDEAIDAIGDIMVVLTHIAHFLETELKTCYLVAWSEIMDRKGKMVDGLFVKEK